MTRTPARALIATALFAAIATTPAWAADPSAVPAGDPSPSADVAPLPWASENPGRDVTWTESRVDIPGAAGTSIPGTLTLPVWKDPGSSATLRFPAVLMLHGTASSRDEVGDMYAREARSLAGHGIASLRIDFAGSGDSTQPQTAFTFTEEVSDTRSALDWLSARGDIDPERLALLGFSQGGRVAATVAGTDPRVKALATWSTWVEDGATAVNLFGEQPVRDAEANGEVLVDLGFRTWTYSKEFFDSIRASSPLRDIAAFTGPILAVNGAEDELAPQSQQMLDAAASTDTTLHTVAGADHIYHVLTDDQSQAQEVLDTTVAWLAERL